MSDISLVKAREIIENILQEGSKKNMQPLSVVVLDPGGNLKAFERSDGASPGRFKVADGKAHAAIMMGIPSSAIMQRAEQQAYFVNALSVSFNGRFTPVSGGVLVKDDDNIIIGAVGVTGDTSENDTIAAVAGIQSAGLNYVA
ncbi:heme-binding protein [Amylibacter sp.]|nr:heme-binding protein [Amylibacter sp.]MDC1445686.1 heme-binding protein [Amylibacter sp.]